MAMRDHRLGELHALEQIGCFSSHSVSPVVVTLQAHRGGDVAGVDALDVFALVGVHLQQAPDALALALARR